MGADVFAAELLRAAAEVRAGTEAIIQSTSVELLGATRSRAPRSTGDYAGSWKASSRSSGNVSRASVFTDHPEAARLEYGFHGRDSRGRVYDQAPQSHQRAAIDGIISPLRASFAALLDRVVRG